MRRQLLLMQGFSLVEALVGLAVSSMALVAAAQIHARFTAADRQVDLEVARARIRRAIVSRVDCRRTMLGNGRPARGVCGGGFLVLFDGDGRPLTGPVDPKRGHAAPLEGGFHLRTTCDDAQQSLTVTVMKFDRDGGYVRDLHGRPLDANHPRARLFGGAPGQAALCLGTLESPAASTGGGEIAADLYDWSAPTPVVRTMVGTTVRPVAEQRRTADEFCVFAGRDYVAGGTVNTPRCQGPLDIYEADPCQSDASGRVCTWPVGAATRAAISESFSGNDGTQRCHYVCYPRRH